MNKLIFNSLLISFLLFLVSYNKNLILNDGFNEFNKIYHEKKFMIFNLLTKSILFKIIKTYFFNHSLLFSTAILTTFIGYKKTKQKFRLRREENQIKIIIKNHDVKNAILYFMESDKEFPKLELKYNSKTNKEERIAIIKSLHKKNSLKRVFYENMPINIVKELILNKKPKSSNVEEDKKYEEENIWLEILRKKYNKKKLENFIYKCMDLYEKEVKINNTTINQVNFQMEIFK